MHVWPRYNLDECDAAAVEIDERRKRRCAGVQVRLACVLLELYAGEGNGEIAGDVVAVGVQG